MQETVNEENYICSNPFAYCEIHTDGNVLPCCPEWCHHYSFGNIFETPFDQIWNGEKIVDFRNKILANDFTLCKRNICTYSTTIKSQIWLNQLKEAYKNNTDKVEIREIKMCWDKECNVACITCRDQIKRNSIKDLEKCEQIKKNLLPFIGTLKIFHCSGSGDPFASKYCRELIKDIADINKEVKFGFHTNGILATMDMFEKLGVKDRICSLEISVHATTKKTYDKIVKYGNFDKVIDNIKKIHEYYKEKPLERFILTFVINNYNYKEIPDFIKFAKSVNAEVCFYYFRHWNTKYGRGKHFDKIALWKPEHPKYNEFLKIVNSPVVKDCNIYYHTDFAELFDAEPVKMSLLKKLAFLFNK